jgi:hypothetical protein
MPEGPRGEKRPADVIGNAVRVMRIATVAKRVVTASPLSRSWMIFGRACATASSL